MAKHNLSLILSIEQSGLPFLRSEPLGEGCLHARKRTDKSVVAEPDRRPAKMIGDELTREEGLSPMYVPVCCSANDAEF